jgi:hypothetical protein
MPPHNRAEPKRPHLVDAIEYPLSHPGKNPQPAVEIGKNQADTLSHRAMSTTP